MFLIKQDYFSSITESDLNKIISFNVYGDIYLSQAERRAVEDVKGYLRSRFDITTIFRDYKDYLVDTEYLTNDRIVFNEAFYLCVKDTSDRIEGSEIPELTNIEYFALSDDRNIKIVEVVTDIVIYNIYSRINNIDLPGFRKERYDGNSDAQMGGAIGWLKRVQRGEIQPDLPLREDTTETTMVGNKVMYGNASEPFEDNESF